MLDAFPTAGRMHLSTSPCVACGVLGPDVSHHFWSCPVAAAVRREVTQQLAAAGFIPPTATVSCASLWLAVKPAANVHTLVWDLVCLAAVHAMEHGRAAAWAVSRDLTAMDLVRQVAARSAVGAFWSALTDFAATLKVPRQARTTALTHQPFIAWHVVLRGNGLRVIRR